MKNRTSRPVRFPELRFVSPSGSAADCRPKPGRGSHQRNEFLYRHLRRADQRAQRSRSYLAMLWDRQACRLSRLGENHMACALAVLDPARLLKTRTARSPEREGKAAIYAGTSTSRTSIVRGMPRAARVSRHPAMASRMLSRASASVRPWEMQPGMEGHSATSMPVSSGSSITSSFIRGFYSTLLAPRSIAVFRSIICSE